MAHVERRGKRYRAVYSKPTGGRGVKTFDRKLDAERYLATTIAAQLRNDWVDPRAGRETLAEYAAKWIERRPIRETTRLRYKGYMGHLGEIATLPLGALTPSAMDDWQAGMLRTMATSTAGTIRGVVSSILKSAERDRLIGSNPLTGVKAPKTERRLVVPLPVETVLDIRDVIAPRYAASVVVGYGCGLRRGETFGLTVDRVDFLRRMITVDRQLIELSDGRPMFGPPKTAASVRKVPMPGVVVEALAAHIRAYPPSADGLIFTTARGGSAVRRKDYWQAWQDAEIKLWARATGRPLLARGALPVATREAWAEAHPTGPTTRYHDLRHFYASLLIDDGANVKEVQARLGHATAAETLDTYSHLWPNNEDNTRRAIDAAFAPKLDDAKRVQS